MPRTRLLWLLLLLTFAFYVPSLLNGFTQDDRYIVQVTGNVYRPNAMVASWQGVATYFTSHYGASQWSSGEGYRPITIMSYAATYALCGTRCFGEAFPHHLVNVALHVFATYLTFRLLAALGSSGIASLAGAAVFGLHALRTEVVAGIVGRAELLAFVFGATALLLWNGLRARWLVGPLLFLAFCSKESALAWVPFLVVFGWANGKGLAGAVGSALIHSFVPLALFLGLRAAALSGLEGPPETMWSANPLVATSVGERVATACFLSVYGLWKTLLPLRLCCDYGAATFEIARGFAEPRSLGALTAVLALVGSALAVARRQPLWFLAVAAYFGFSFLTSNVPFPTGVIFAERLLYAPALALSFVAAALVARWPCWLVLVWLVPSVVEGMQRVSTWRDDLTLFRTDSERNPRSLRLLGALSKAVADQGPSHLEEAIGPLQRALEIEPELASTWFSLGALLVDLAQRPGTEEGAQRDALARAETALRKGLIAKRALPETERWRPNVILGGVCLRRGDLGEADRYLTLGIELNPRYLPAWMDLGRLGDAWLATGRRDLALRIFERMATTAALDAELRRSAQQRWNQLR